MNVIEIIDKSMIAHLFDGWQETMIWSCLQDCMGRAWAVVTEPEPVPEEEPIPDFMAPQGKKGIFFGHETIGQSQSAQISIGDFCFFAGRPERELVSHWPENCSRNSVIMVPQSEGWSQLIQSVYGVAAVRTTRYAIKKEPDIFDICKLSDFVSQLPDSCRLRPIDRQLYREILTLDWARDLCSQFESALDYERRGLGMVAVQDGEILSGASSYTVYRSGIEIEIDTREDMRRRGLALACGAALILECLKRGLYPSWDAHDMKSVRLAEKLGYHMDQAYPVYEVTR